MRIALVTAHPDDAEIFAGGIVAAYRRMGAEVAIVVATDGAKGGPGDPRDLARRRAAEARAGAALLGAELMLLGFPDGALAAAPDFAARLADRLAAVAPDLVLSHGPHDYHADHRAVAQAAAAAVSFRAPLAWLDTPMGVGQQPTHYVDITADDDLKARAILCHASQDPHRFVEQARLQARFRAAQCGHDGFAEAIRHEPAFPFADIRALLPAPPPMRPLRDRRADTAPSGAA
ncbi:MAG: PIG-L family deacetylase [Alphaproteobacteria bacterium]